MKSASDSSFLYLMNQKRIFFPIWRVIQNAQKHLSLISRARHLAETAISRGIDEELNHWGILYKEHFVEMVKNHLESLKINEYESYYEKSVNRIDKGTETKIGKSY